MTDVEKRGIGKAKLGLVLAVFVGILAISNAWTYSSMQGQISSISDLQTQLKTVQSQLDALDVKYKAYTTEHSYANAEYNALKSQLSSLDKTYQEYLAKYRTMESEYNALKNERDALKAPKLSTLSVKAIDSRPINGTPYLYIVGEVWNLGKDTAYDCKLKVLAYQGSVIAIDTQVPLGTITGYNKYSVDSKIVYKGSALTNATIKADWITG